MIEAHGELEQEGRRDPRYEGRLEAVLRVDGAWWRCWIRDLPLGGARLDPAIQAANIATFSDSILTAACAGG